MSEEGEKTKGLNILCIDGGGVRGLSSLVLISEIMKRLCGLEGQDSLKPINYFDIIAGTGTGGVSACMLGRLGMSVDEAIAAYKKLSQEVFSDKKVIRTSGSSEYKGDKLEAALRAMVQSVTGNEQERMMRGLGGCKVMVFAMSRRNMNPSIPTIFRSYHVAANAGPNCTIWEALYATMAHPDLFKSIEISDGPIRQSFVGGEFGCSNPISHVLTEVKRLYPDREVSSIVSIGAGHARTISIPTPGPGRGLLRAEAVVAMMGMATDSEREAEAMAARFRGTTRVYYRFNVDQGLQNANASDWERLGEIATHTHMYIANVDTNSKIDQAVQAIKEKRNAVSVASVDGEIQVPSALRQTNVKHCPAPTSRFTGRGDEVQHIGACIVGGVEERRVCIVHGLGGAGKPQLALKVIEIKRERWSHVLYMDASSKEAIESSLQEFAKAQHVGETHGDTLSWLASLREPWLLVFDNADHPSLKIHEYFPGGNHGSILITTRLSDLTAHARGPCSVCHISSMDPGDALALLLRMTCQQAQELVESEMKEATALLQELGHLALAIVHAGAYIGHCGMSISKYREQFHTGRRSMLDRYTKLKVKVDSYEKSVFMTWKMCYDLLEENGNCRPLLWLMAFLHHDGITEEIFERAAMNIQSYEPLLPPTKVEIAALNYTKELFGRFLDGDGRWDSVLFLEAMSELASYSLIDFDRSNSAYSVHVLVQEWARTVSSEPPEIGLECATILLSRSITEDDTLRARIFKRRLGLHITKVLSEQGGKVSANYAPSFAQVYGENGQWYQKESLEIITRAEMERTFGVEHPYTLISINNLAYTCSHQGRWGDAEELQLRAVDACKHTLGEEHPDTLTSMNNLAYTYLRQGRWNEAEALQLQVMRAYEHVIGGCRAKLGSTNTHLPPDRPRRGWCGNAKVPRRLPVLLTDFCYSTIREERPYTLPDLGNLVAINRNQGRLGNAEVLEMQVLSRWRRILGEQSSYTPKIMGNLASIYSRQSRWDEAEELQLQVVHTCRNTLGEEHPDMLTSMNHLACIYSYQGRCDDAEALRVKILDTCKRVLGEEHPDTLSSMGNLASTFWKQGRLRDAEALEMQVINTSRKILGEEHPDTLTSMGNLASTYRDQGRFGDGETLQLQVLNSRKRVLAAGHPHTLASMRNLASLFISMHRWDEAESLLMQAVAAWERGGNAEGSDAAECKKLLDEVRFRKADAELVNKAQIQQDSRLYVGVETSFADILRRLAACVVLLVSYSCARFTMFLFLVLSFIVVVLAHLFL